MPSTSSMGSHITHSERRKHRPQGDPFCKKTKLDIPDDMTNEVYSPENMNINIVHHRLPELVDIQNELGLREALSKAPDFYLDIMEEDESAYSTFPSSFHNGTEGIPDWFVFTVRFGTKYSNFLTCYDDRGYATNTILAAYAEMGYNVTEFKRGVSSISSVMIDDETAMACAQDYGLLGCDELIPHIKYIDGRLNVPYTPLRYDGDLCREVVSFGDRSKVYPTPLLNRCKQSESFHTGDGVEKTILWYSYDIGNFHDALTREGRSTNKPLLTNSTLLELRDAGYVRIAGHPNEVN